MKLCSRETLYRTRNTFFGLQPESDIPSFPFGKPKKIPGYVTKDNAMLYFGALDGVYASNPKRINFDYSISWDNSTSLLCAYFSLRNVALEGIFLGAQERFPLNHTYDVAKHFNGLFVESYRNKTHIYPSNIAVNSQKPEIDIVNSDSEITGPSVDRLVDAHIDIILEKVIAKQAV